MPIPDLRSVPARYSTHHRRADDRPRVDRYLQRLLADGRIKSVIDRRYALEQAVEAHRYVETNRRIGNVVPVVDGKATAARPRRLKQADHGTDSRLRGDRASAPAAVGGPRGPLYSRDQRGRRS